MNERRVMPRELARRALDELPFDLIAEYVCDRAARVDRDLLVGRRELHLKFRDGAFERAYSRAPLIVR